MRILVDADACPVKQIIVRRAKKTNIPVTMLIDISHDLNDGSSNVIVVDKHADSVDYALMGFLNRNERGFSIATTLLPHKWSVVCK